MTVYTPREDSFLLQQYLQQMDLEDKKALDMGTGSGIQAFTMAENGAEVKAVDINPEAAEHVCEEAERRGIDIEVRESDFFSQVEESFDLIVFNPPYLPGKKGIGDEEIWRGGSTGLETVEKFLEQADDYLEQGGKVLTVLSSETDWKELKDRHGLEVVGSEKLWFETVYLVEKR